jgi:hypothetical protein
MSSTPDPSDPIDPLLDRWSHLEPPRMEADGLAHEVWRRIADAEVDATAPTWWGRIEGAFQRPSFDFAFVAACTLFGLFLAEVRVSHLQAEHNVELAKAYVHLIDPLLDKSVAMLDEKSSSLP